MEMTKEFDARNAEKSRAVCEAMAERADTGKRVLTERERQILDMWPRFEDGEPVMVGDEVKADPIFGGGTGVARAIEFMDFAYIVKSYISEPIAQDRFEARVKRPAPKVLDADGMEIKVGDTVYEPNGQSGIVAAVHPSTRCVDLRQDGCDAFCMDANRLTHARPDSWERLEENAADLDDMPCDFNAKNLIRRAKALARAEACR